MTSLLVREMDEDVVRLLMTTKRVRREKFTPGRQARSSAPSGRAFRPHLHMPSPPLFPDLCRHDNH